MDSPYSPLEFMILNGWQRDLPLVPEPFAVMGDKCGVREDDVLGALKRLHGKGAVSRVGAVFAPWRIGVSTLAAMAVPPQRIEEVAAIVSRRGEVNHNYQREHRYNLWFVATARDEARLAAALDGIAESAGLPVISLPLAEQFHIDLGFDLCDAAKERRAAGAFERRPLDAAEQRLAAALETGLPLVRHPFAQLAGAAGSDEAATIAQLRRWLDEGIVKRFGVVVRHRELGYRANAMVVFDVPDAEASAVGARLAGEPGVTLCYRRRRHLPEWPYNVYCMVHGKSREEVEPVVERLAGIAGRRPEILFSTRRFKQRGARYFHGA
ncbi:MAG TPA: Lrp/AsnC family transcriptional regulator [Rhodocyclaceae bacterium]